MNAAAWARRNFRLRTVTSDQLFYDHMESQSAYSLPLLYQPFDPNRRAHWHDRGAILDFAAAAGGGRVLDLGPGDGWPSIAMAPFCSAVIGVEASARRVEVCRANARRLGFRNVEFVHVPQGERLPFPDASFDGVVAATSLEQAAHPLAMLRELHRILKPGGRLRMTYEALDRYAGGREEEIWLGALDGDRSQVVFYERQPEQERAVHVALRLNASLEQTRRLLDVEAGAPR